MSGIKKIFVSLIALVLIIGNGLPANAANMQIRLLSFGANDRITDGDIKFTMDFAGGEADSANSCATLVANLGEHFAFDFSTAAGLESAPSNYFDVADGAISATSLTCIFTSNIFVGHLDSSQESTAVVFRVLWDGNAVLSHAGQILNPNYKGHVTISTPVRGQNIQGWAPIKYNLDVGAGRTVDSVSISLCESKCGYGADEAKVYPNLENHDGSAGGGFVGAGTTTGVNAFFTSTGIYEVRVRVRVGEVVSDASVFVNVTSALNSTPIPIDTALALINSASQSIGLDSKLDCGSAPLTAGSLRACQFSLFGSSGRLEAGNLMTTASVSVYSSLNGGSFTLVKKIQATTDSPVAVSVPVGKSMKSFAIRTYIDGYVATEGAYRAAYQEAVWGPPPTTISLAVQSLIRWGVPFKISITASKKLNGSCKIAQNNLSVISAFKLVAGKGAGTAKVLWAGGLGSTITLPLFAYCNVGGVNASAFKMISGIR